ncbi:FeoA family protein [Nocardia sp. IFM 10818]
MECWPTVPKRTFWTICPEYAPNSGGQLWRGKPAGTQPGVPAVTLMDGVRGQRFRIDRIIGDRRHRRRLLEMGLLPGTAVEVVGVGAFGGRILRIDDARVAVDAGTARQIEVSAA